MSLSPLPEIFEDLRAGRMVVLVDDPDRENEGDLVMAAQFATPEKIAFMLRHTSGIVCVTLPQAKADALDLPLQVESSRNSSRYGTQFTVSVEAVEGVTTGVSAADRATTIQTIAREYKRLTGLEPDVFDGSSPGAIEFGTFRYTFGPTGWTRSI